MARNSEDNDAETHYEEKSVLTCYAAWSAIFVALAGTWPYGFSIGSINSIYFVMKTVIQDQYEERWNETVSTTVVDAVWVASSAAFPVGGIFGSLLVGPIVRRYGRLNGIFLGHICTILFTLLLSLSGIFKSPEIMILSRFGIGITSGAIGLGISVMYTTEVSPQKYRGVFGSMVSAGIALSLLFSNILGLSQIFGNETLWPLLFAFTALPSIVLVLTKKTIAQSPRQLYMDEEEKEKAVELLQKLHGVDDVAHLIGDMDQEKRDAGAIQQMSVKEVLLSKSLHRPLLAAIVLTTGQQLTGLNGVAFNMNAIYLKSGIHENYVQYVSIGTYAMIITITVLGAYLTERRGRKFLLILGYSIIGASLLLLTISIETYEFNDKMAYVSVAASLGFWTGFSLGPGPVTLVAVGEFFDQSARSSALTISVALLWISFAITVVITPYLLAAIGGYTFLPFSFMAIMTAIFIKICIPETKNMAFRQMRRSFNRRSKKYRRESQSRTDDL
uniref:solute carrier family 2, facilitated glucose transporter member 5-like isoform X2 n=1 Tax=Styela clava TaxID=7725 RepID=UPI00193AC7D9|nr:solute carrier family 2, facilitated glucose transporter member 5-like isoform X2 [Styela clava]